MSHYWLVCKSSHKVFAILAFLSTTIPLGTNHAQDFWQQTNGPYTGSVTCFLVISDTVDGDRIFAGTGSGIFKSTNRGATWTQQNAGLSSTSVRALVTTTRSGEPRHIFAGTSGGVFRSTDDGNSWSSSSTGLASLVVNALAFCPCGDSNGTLFAGTNSRVAISADNGSNWQTAGTGLPLASISSLAINDSGHVFAGASASLVGIYRSTDCGLTWTHVTAGTTVRGVLSLAVPRAIQTRDYVYAGTQVRGVYRSTNNGNSWTQTNAGLTNLRINAIVSIERALSPPLTYAITAGGLLCLSAAIQHGLESGVELLTQ